jgi:Notch-like protein
VTMTNTKIMGNVGVSGGGIYITASNNFETVFTGGIISGNTASSYGGGVYMAGTDSAQMTYFNFRETTFENNFGSKGYHVHTSSTHTRPRFVNCKFTSTTNPGGYTNWFPLWIYSNLNSRKCDTTPCTVAPYTITCIDRTLPSGVFCTDNSLVPVLSTYGEFVPWDCSTVHGKFYIVSDCTLTDEIVLTGNLILEGENNVIIAADDKRHFNVPSGETLSLTSLILTGGKAPNSNDVHGGSIYNVGTLYVTNCLFHTNAAASGQGGAIRALEGTIIVIGTNFTSNTAMKGGAISSSSDTTVTLEDVVFSGNTASNGDGGAVQGYGAVIIFTNVHIHDNTASDGDGGGVWLSTAYGAVVEKLTTMTNVHIHDNTATNEGGGIYAKDYVSLVILESTFENNEATSTSGHQIKTVFTGGGIMIMNTDFKNTITTGTQLITADTLCSSDPCTVAPYTATCVDRVDIKEGVTCSKYFVWNQENLGHYHVMSDIILTGGIVLTDDLTLEGENNVITAASNSKHFEISAGKTLRLTGLILTGGSVTGETDNDGGSIHNEGVLYVTNCLFHSNTGGFGGAIRVYNSATLTVINTNFTSNSAHSGGAIHADRSGGGGYSGSVTLTNAVLSGNTATYKGGAIYAYDSLVSLTNVHIHDNTAVSSGGGIRTLSNLTPNLLTLRECTFENNEALNDDGHQIKTARPDSYTSGASITVVNTNFESAIVTGTQLVLDIDPPVCSSNPCTVAPYTATCVDRTDIKEGVTCAKHAWAEETSGTYNVGSDITLTGEIVLVGDLTLHGNNILSPNMSPEILVPTNTLTAKTDFPHFKVPTGKTLTLNWLSFEGGTATHEESPGGYYGGGSIYAEGMVYITNCVFRDNTANYRGGAIRIRYAGSKLIVKNTNFTSNNANNGGAIYSGYTEYSVIMELTNVIFSNNVATGATGDGGAIGISYISSAKLTNVVFCGNRAAYGGAIRAYGDITLRECTFENNLATELGSQAYITGTAAAIVNTKIATDQWYLSTGSYIKMCSDTLYQCTVAPYTSFCSNIPNSGGVTCGTDTDVGWDCSSTSGTFDVVSDCGLLNEIFLTGDLTLTGENNVIATMANERPPGTLYSRHFNIPSGKTLNLTGLKLTGGLLTGSNDGGSIFNAGTLYVTNCLFHSNTAGNAGGAIEVYADATLVVVDTNFTSNTAPYGGAIHTGYNGGSYNGGVTLTNVILSGNTATNKGGAIYAYDSLVSLTNVILSDNQAPEGGGIRAKVNILTLRECTFENNEATSNSGHQIYTSNSASITVVNTIFKNVNTGGTQLVLASNPSTCSSNPCTVAPYAAICVDRALEGVTCQRDHTCSSTTDKKYYPISSSFESKPYESKWIHCSHIEDVYTATPYELPIVSTHVNDAKCKCTSDTDCNPGFKCEGSYYVVRDTGDQDVSVDSIDLELCKMIALRHRVLIAEESGTPDRSVTKTECETYADVPENTLTYTSTFRGACFKTGGAYSYEEVSSTSASCSASKSCIKKMSRSRTLVDILSTGISGCTYHGATETFQYLDSTTASTCTAADKCVMKQQGTDKTCLKCDPGIDGERCNRINVDSCTVKSYASYTVSTSGYTDADVGMTSTECEYYATTTTSTQWGSAVSDITLPHGCVIYNTENNIKYNTANKNVQCSTNYKCVEKIPFLYDDLSCNTNTRELVSITERNVGDGTLYRPTTVIDSRVEVRSGFPTYNIVEEDCRNMGGYMGTIDSDTKPIGCLSTSDGRHIFNRNTVSTMKCGDTEYGCVKLAKGCCSDMSQLACYTCVNDKTKAEACAYNSNFIECSTQTCDGDDDSRKHLDLCGVCDGVENCDDKMEYDVRDALNTISRAYGTSNVIVHDIRDKPSSGTAAFLKGLFHQLWDNSVPDHNKRIEVNLNKNYTTLTKREILKSRNDVTVQFMNTEGSTINSPVLIGYSTIEVSSGMPDMSMSLEECRFEGKSLGYITATGRSHWNHMVTWSGASMGCIIYDTIYYYNANPTEHSCGHGSYNCIQKSSSSSFDIDTFDSLMGHGEAVSFYRYDGPTIEQVSGNEYYIRTSGVPLDPVVSSTRPLCEAYATMLGKTFIEVTTVEYTKYCYENDNKIYYNDHPLSSKECTTQVRCVEWTGDGVLVVHTLDSTGALKKVHDYELRLSDASIVKTGVDLTADQCKVYALRKNKLFAQVNSGNTFPSGCSTDGNNNNVKFQTSTSTTTLCDRTCYEVLTTGEAPMNMDATQCQAYAGNEGYAWHAGGYWNRYAHGCIQFDNTGSAGSIDIYYNYGWGNVSSSFACGAYDAACVQTISCVIECVKDPTFDRPTYDIFNTGNYDTFMTEAICKQYATDKEKDYLKVNNALYTRGCIYDNVNLKILFNEATSQKDCTFFPCLRANKYIVLTTSGKPDITDNQLSSNECEAYFVKEGNGLTFEGNVINSEVYPYGCVRTSTHIYHVITDYGIACTDTNKCVVFSATEFLSTTIIYKDKIHSWAERYNDKIVSGSPNLSVTSAQCADYVVKRAYVDGGSSTNELYPEGCVVTGSIVYFVTVNNNVACGTTVACVELRFKLHSIVSGSMLAYSVDAVGCSEDPCECEANEYSIEGTECLPDSITTCTSGYVLVSSDPLTDDSHCVDIDECLNSPCQNGGTCVNSAGSYTCTCLAGYEGTNCETNIDDCHPNPCLYEGICTDGIDSFTCACVDGFTGYDCSGDGNNCDPNPCQNGGTCTDGFRFFNCTCSDGFFVPICEDHCASNPCLNGQCTNLEGSYNCFCEQGWEGTDCDNSKDDCVDVDCNNGVCVDSHLGYDCLCESGYEGIACENEVNHCVGVSCLHGGTCTSTMGSFVCSCLNGYSGTLCEMNLCNPNPCARGTCIGISNGFECWCPSGYNGSMCELNIDECIPTPCVNAASCTDGINDYTCACLIGWEGKECQKNIDDCATTPCLNGGTCVDHLNSFTCTCADGFGGTLCENEFNECADEPCKNGASCEDLIDDYSCKCQAGWEGTECQDEIDECDETPCHLGTCTDLFNDYECNCTLTNRTGKDCDDCLIGWEGEFCNERIQYCIPMPCIHGTCREKLGGYECDCTGGFVGKNCQNGFSVVTIVSIYTGVVAFIALLLVIALKLCNVI